jgi:hypothetical protein
LVEGPSPDSWKGGAEATEGFREWISAWDEFCVEAEEYRELDDERARDRALADLDLEE